MKDRKSISKIALPLEPAELVREWQEKHSGYTEEGEVCEEVKIFLRISVGDRVGEIN